MVSYTRSDFSDTAIAINLGGFVIPFAAACYLGITSHNLASLEICIVMIALTHIVAVCNDGFGIKLSGYIGIVSLMLALLLLLDETATVAFVARVAGILIGLCTVFFAIDCEQHRSARISLGDAGSVQAIYITMLLAVLINTVA